MPSLVLEEYISVVKYNLIVLKRNAVTEKY